MTRGNQRDKAREAAQKKAASQKKGNTMSGTEMQRAKESAAEIMRQKQANGESLLKFCLESLLPMAVSRLNVA
ncbi:hypothetical protein COL5a_005350 [Colletotrichum fioriniae]|nr:uncharacterized protein COL516b_006107 [Colletotrichum fioriniae]KAJ0304216.1 hypothetical protein COL516b_006107 [Colletotrichum fioriniae]KAJ0328145.1 hypothetical protein COL5a_005350 [Colletotrichum fioriniae]